MGNTVISVAGFAGRVADRTVKTVSQPLARRLPRLRHERQKNRAIIARMETSVHIMLDKARWKARDMDVSDIVYITISSERNLMQRNALEVMFRERAHNYGLLSLLLVDDRHYFVKM